MKRTSATFFILLTTLTLTAGQPSQAVLDYIDQYQEMAINEMIEYRIPASITMAQGILESGAGQSELAKKSNNHFGIKCHTDWKGDKVYYDDDAKDECFRKYDHVEDSYRDHSEFLYGKTRYAALFELDPDDYKGWAKGLKEAGYATNPKYADLLINLIEEYELNKFDKMSLADVKKRPKKIEKENDATAGIKKTDKKADKKKNIKEDNFTWGGYNGEVYYFNRIPTINIKDGDTPEKLADDHHVKLSLLRDYNDIENGGELDPGTKFYLQPKRKNGTTKYHIVKQEETMWIISREEGVRLSYIYKYNLLEPGQEPAVGEQIYLRNKRKDLPKLKGKLEGKGREKEAGEKSEKQTEIYIEDDEQEMIVPKQKEAEKEIPVIEYSEKKEELTLDKTIAPPPIYHIVAVKETLYALSKKYAITVAQIREWNKLTDNSINIGQKLIVGFK